MEIAWSKHEIQIYMAQQNHHGLPTKSTAVYICSVPVLYGSITDAKQRITNVGRPASSTTTLVRVFNEANLASIHLSVVQLSDGVLHVTECSKLCHSIASRCQQRLIAIQSTTRNTVIPMLTILTSGSHTMRGVVSE